MYARLKKSTGIDRRSEVGQQEALIEQRKRQILAKQETKRDADSIIAANTNREEGFILNHYLVNKY